MTSTDYWPLPHPWAEDINRVWHQRADNFWDRNIMAEVRFHSLCGKGLWSCHVSAYDPREPGAEDLLRDARYCPDCDALQPLTPAPTAP